MIWVDRLGFDMRLFSPQKGTFEVRIPFPREVTDEKGAKSTFNCMSQQAWEVERNFYPPDFQKVTQLKHVKSSWYLNYIFVCATTYQIFNHCHIRMYPWPNIVIFQKYDDVCCVLILWWFIWGLMLRLLWKHSLIKFCAASFGFCLVYCRLPVYWTIFERNEQIELPFWIWEI